MDENKLAPISIEIVAPDEISQVDTFSKVESSEDRISLGSKLNTVLSAAGDVLEMAEGANLYKVAVPDGYTLKDLIPSKKDAEAVRALVKDSNGKINGDVSLKLNGISPTQVATMGLAAAAMVVGQAYMTEISNSLHSIDSKLNVIESIIAGEQKAKVKNAIFIANTYVNLYDEYRKKPPEAFQAARNEIESRYNDVGSVIDWITEQLANLEERTLEAKANGKELSPLLEELRSYEEQFTLCLQALSALGMTRMYYDGCIDENSALIERQRIEFKSQQFLETRQRLSGIMETRISALKGAPIALPQRKDEKNIFKSLTSQTPRAAAKSQLLETKKTMQTNLRNSTSKLRKGVTECASSINRIASANQTAQTLLTDGTSFWIAENSE